MRIDVLTLFPEMFQGVLGSSMLGRAAQGGILEFHLHNIRDWSTNKHHNADDYPFGGGAGMVMMAQPIWDCLDQVDPNHQALRIALLPRGEPCLLYTSSCPINPATGGLPLRRRRG